eukprot:6487592-Amphidinium_carterae.1
MLELRRAWDHMLHRLAEVVDDAQRLRIQKFMREFLPKLRADVRDHAGSSDQLTQSIERLSGALAQELMRWNVMAMEPQKAFRTLRIPELQKIHEHEIVAPKSQGDFLGKGMFAVHKGWWQPPSSSGSSLASDSFSRIPVAVKTYNDDSDDDNCGSVEEDKRVDVRASKLGKLLDRVEQNAQRQQACAHNNVLRIFGTCRPPLRGAHEAASLEFKSHAESASNIDISMGIGQLSLEVLSWRSRWSRRFIEVGDASLPCRHAVANAVLISRDESLILECNC